MNRISNAKPGFLKEGGLKSVEEIVVEKPPKTEDRNIFELSARKRALRQCVQKT